jgi:uncharacterized protein with von Willebrand factor type A (vWA) domain
LPLLVLVDVSGSMERYARLLLAFLHAATRGIGPPRRVRLRHAPHRPDAGLPHRRHRRHAGAAGALIDDFAGGTRLGESLATLRLQHARRLVGRRTLVLVISDGLDTGEPAELDRELDWLTAAVAGCCGSTRCCASRAMLPLARGAAVLHRHAHAMLAVHDLSKLEELAASLAP